VTAILWVLSLAAHLGFDYLAGGHLAGGHGTGGASFGSATILLYLAVTFRSRSGHVRRGADGCYRALAAHVDFRSERGHRPGLTRPGRRAAWPVVYPGPGVRHD
jgi:hypothetical protein